MLVDELGGLIGDLREFRAGKVSLIGWNSGKGRGWKSLTMF